MKIIVLGTQNSIEILVIFSGFQVIELNNRNNVLIKNFITAGIL